MIFGPTEIMLCLGPMMLVILCIGLALAAQNVAVDRAEANKGLMACLHCRKMLNPEAYICRFCRKELRDPQHA